MTLLRRVGWTSLLVWACVGLALESAQGLKLSSYLDDAMRRELCTLAHAHGVGLAIVAIVIGELGLPIVAESRRAFVARATAFAAIAVPIAFLFSSIDHTESDPGIAIWIVPIGALALIAALAVLAYSAWRVAQTR